jgi:hypothetical protein
VVLGLWVVGEIALVLIVGSRRGLKAARMQLEPAGA